MFFSFWSAFRHASVQLNSTPFLSRFVNGFTSSENPGMNGLWNPNTPSVLLTSLMLCSSSGQSRIPSTLTGLMAI